MKPDDIAILVFIVFGLIVSAINKLFQEMKRRQRPYQRPTEVTDWTEDEVRTAKRRGSAPRPVADTGAPEIEDVIRRLMGVEKAEPQEGPTASNEEGEWKQVPPPIVRRAPEKTAPKQKPVMPRQMYDRPQPQKQRPQSMPKPPTFRPTVNMPTPPPPRQQMPQRPQQVAEPRRDAEELLPEEVERREQERRWREEMERRRKVQAAQQAELARRATPEVKHSHARLRPATRRLLHNKAELRRALILNEVLGPPRAFRDLGHDHV